MGYPTTVSPEGLSNNKTADLRVNREVNPFSG